jgi:chemotaxis response regulator CheB
MPKEAIALGAAQQVLPVQEITPFLLTKIFVDILLALEGRGF